MNKHCIAGQAYLIEKWTNEKEWWKRKKVMFCWKCDRRIEWNILTHRYNHIKKKEKKEKRK